MRILVTGGAGFIGSHFVLKWARANPESKVLNLDKLTYAADLSFLKPLEGHSNYQFIQADLAQRTVVRNIVREFRPDGVIHFAAESHVDNSIRDPEAFIQSNVLGTFNLLEELRQLWMQNSDQFKKNRFHHVSTDEVFGSLGETGKFTEESPYQPRSPYSASKAASDHWVRAYQHTYGMNTTLSNCSNNFGPHQHEEKLIPTVIRKALQNEPIPVYGKGLNCRDWLYVEDHCDAIERIFKNGRTGETYNVGGSEEWQNLKLVELICKTLDESVGQGPKTGYQSLIQFVQDRPGHDFRYAIDSSKIQKELGWKPEKNFTERLKSTVKWYVERRARKGAS